MRAVLRSLLTTHRITTLVVAWALLAWALQVVWLLADQGPPESDDWHHLTKAEIIWSGWQQGGIGGVLDGMDALRSAYPPLVHLCAQPAFWLAGGFSAEAAALSITPWLIVMVLATYGIARRALGDGAGAAAAVMVSALPIVVSLSRKFLLDFPLAAAITVSLWALLRSDRLRKPGWVFVAGVLFGVALLAKFLAGVFLMGAWLWLLAGPVAETVRRWPLRSALVGLPLLAVVIWLGLDALAWYRELIAAGTIAGGGSTDFWIERVGGAQRFGLWWLGLALASVGLLIAALRAEHEGLRGVLGFGAAVAVAGWLAGSWYLPHAREVALFVTMFSVEAGVSEGDPGAATLTGWLFYPWALARSMPRAWYLMLLIGTPMCLIHPRLRRRLAPLACSGLVALVVMNLSDNREMRYAISLAPLVAIAATAWVTVLPRLHRRLIWGTVIAMALVFSAGWIPVAAQWWRPHPALVWKQERVLSSGRTITDFEIPLRIGPGDVLWTPRFYVVAPLPRFMPYEDGDLPFGNPGP
jgi:4-amino-4-deoxy-L-arabinose transferase-like glycosyltransferase